MILMHGHAPRRAWFYYTLQRLKLPCFLLLVVLGGKFLSCSKKQAEYQPTDPLGIANKWVYDSMKLYYYWSDQMTKSPDYSLPTQDFFKQLLSAEDRFSYINNRTDVSAPKSIAELYGLHFTFIQHPFNPQQLVGVITLVVPNSEADSRVHLKRGMFISKVNDKVITLQNINAVIKDMEYDGNSAVMLQLAALNASGTSLDDSVRVAVTKKAVTQRSIYATRFFSKNGVNTAYLPYVLCAEKDDGTLLQKILTFKGNNITELILDLRYNPGGSVASVSKLAAALVPGFKPDNTFITYRGNRNGGTVKLSFNQAIQFSAYASGKDMSYLQTINLGLKRIFILTSPATASAAELLCNNLKPYVQVKLIGDKTLGKDEASFTIQDAGNPHKVDWIINPIVYKVADANGKGGYSSGITPDYTVNEFSTLPLSEMGMPGDLPVDKALELIYGTSQVDVIPVRRNVHSFPGVHAVFYSSQTSVNAVNANY